MHPPDPSPFPPSKIRQNLHPRWYHHLLFQAKCHRKISTQHAAPRRCTEDAKNKTNHFRRLLRRVSHSRPPARATPVCAHAWPRVSAGDRVPLHGLLRPPSSIDFFSGIPRDIRCKALNEYTHWPSGGEQEYKPASVFVEYNLVDLMPFRASFGL